MSTSYQQLLDEHAQDLNQMSGQEQLPVYSEATKGRSSTRQANGKTPGRFDTLKSILNGNVHQYNPRLVLDRAMTESMNAQPAPAQRPDSGRKSSSSSSSSSSSTKSTLKSILTGDVYKHHPAYRIDEMYRLEEERRKREVSDSRVRDLTR